MTIISLPALAARLFQQEHLRLAVVGPQGGPKTLTSILKL